MTPDDPFAFGGMTDAQVLELAVTHYQRAARWAPGSQRRAVEWAKFTGAYGEYSRRQDVRALRCLAAAGRLTKPNLPGPRQRTARN